MSKKLRRGVKLYIAPDILGWMDDHDEPVVKDERNNTYLDPRNIDDKIIIYERQVKDWFLAPATKCTKTWNNGFIIMMICMSYLEGVEQYKSGQSSNNNSREFFKRSIHRLYPNKYDDNHLDELYSEARCGLFHDGMVRGKIIYNYSFQEPLEFGDYDTIKLNPKKLLEDIKSDFKAFIESLKSDPGSRAKFDRMYSNL
ncbi:hypothetical protein KKA87_13470 [bacterium]|nr:hypothetical protein [bacterium]MBU1874870.1 hypothetical protein [bacterium]